jgi:hypothetical protein
VVAILSEGLAVKRRKCGGLFCHVIVSCQELAEPPGEPSQTSYVVDREELLADGVDNIAPRGS